MSRPLPWPFESERSNPTVRARRIAQSYRAALEKASPQLCEQVDEMALRYGETWISGQARIYNDDDLVSPRVAADLLCVSIPTVKRYRDTGRLTDYGEKGVASRFRVGDLRQLPTLPLGRPPRSKSHACAEG